MRKCIGIFLLGIVLMMPSVVFADGSVHQATAKQKQVEGNAYFDCRTGHKYLKKDHQTYMEFSRKGRFMKTVPATLPLLVYSHSIHPISDENYILYKKSVQGETRFKSLNAVSPHPHGWQAHKLLMVLN